MAHMRLAITVNGVAKFVVFDPEKDMLADVLRRHGYLGVKVGCGKGQCGACNVILNGKLVRSCVTKMSKVPEYSLVETIEGFGTANALHPLQAAWMAFGGAQCGFCTPGFIVSAKALLDQNPSPTRTEVREWFQKHRNVCRCTGYKPLVDAVMAAAEVMRGEKPLESLIYSKEEDIYGSSMPRPTAVGKVLGLTEYGDDIRHHMPEGTLHMALVQPRKYSHAKILNIDIEAASEMPGVVKVITAKDVKGNNRMLEPLPHPSAVLDGTEAPILADDKIRHYGDIVGAVVADTYEHARAAAAAVVVELEPLPEYRSYLDAVAPGAMTLYDKGDTNIFMTNPLIKGEDTRDVIDDSYASVDCSFYAQHEPHMSVEGETVQAYYDPDGNVTVQCKSQAIYFNLDYIATGIGLPKDKLRIIMNPSGGSFGWSTHPLATAIAAICLMEVGQPLTCTLTYEEFMHYSGKRSASFTNARLACDEKGKLTALEFDIGCDHGPYFSDAYAELEAMVRFVGYPYYVPNIRGLARMAVTNHAYACAYRGLGSPQCYTSFEAMLDNLAHDLNIDPFEMRYMNVARGQQTSTNNRPYRQPSASELMDIMRPHYEAAKKEIEGKETDEFAYGIGLSLGGFMSGIGTFDHAEVDLELNPDGTITHYNTWEDVGQGGDIGTLTHTVKALEPLGIKPDQVHLMLNDSKRCPDSGLAAGSRCHMMVGNATIDAAEQMLKAMKKEDGTYRTYDEMVAEGLPTKFRGANDCGGTGENISFKTGEGSPNHTTSYGCFMGIVEVNKKTGEVKCLKQVVVADVGIVGNKLSVDGQAYGGISHTIGYALKEEYDDVKKGGSLVGAGIPYIMDIPDDIEVIYYEDNPRELGPFGSAGCSELFQSSGHMTVLNGIYDAVGVRLYEMPAKPAKVKAAMEAKARGEELKPYKYYLGPDFYDTIEELSK